MSTSNSTVPWQAARIEMPGGRRSWTVLDDDGDVVECVRHWIVHLEQTHASPNTIRAYVRHVVDFANFIAANGAGIPEATVSLYDSFLVWRLARRKDALPGPRLILLRKQETRVRAPSTRNQIQLAVQSFYRFYNGTDRLPAYLGRYRGATLPSCPRPPAAQPHRQLNASSLARNG